MSFSYQTYFIVNLLLLAVAMKWLALKLVRTNTLETKQFWLSPQLSPTRLGPWPGVVDLLVRQFFFFILGWMYWGQWRDIESPTMAAYLSFPLIWFSTEWLGATLLLLFSAKKSALIHDDPWKARSLSDFWGRRWNRWVRSWLVAVTRSISKERIMVGLILSGIFHEVMFALPYQLSTGQFQYGRMTGYFAIQGVGLHLEKHFGKYWHPVFKRFYTWAWVLLPLPLFAGPSFLALFQWGHP